MRRISRSVRSLAAYQGEARGQQHFQPAPGNIPSQAEAYRYVEPYENTFQPDIAQFADMRREAQRHNPNFNRHRHKPPPDHLREGGHPVGVRMISKLFTTLAPGDMELALSNNAARLRFLLVNLSGMTVFWSYGNLILNAGLPILGIPLLSGATFNECSYAVSRDDIYILSPVAGASVLVYEGLPE